MCGAVPLRESLQSNWKIRQLNTSYPAHQKTLISRLKRPQDRLLRLRVGICSSSHPLVGRLAFRRPEALIGGKGLVEIFRQAAPSCLESASNHFHTLTYLLPSPPPKALFAITFTYSGHCESVQLTRKKETDKDIVNGSLCA